jgi:hypothetical protein
MPLFRIIFMILIMLPPKPSAWVASLIVRRPDIAAPLIRICERESKCNRISIHERDAHISPKEYWGQVSWGHLDRSCQKYSPDGWATRGAFGLSAGAHWHYMPRCYQPEWFDIPLVSAIVSAQKYIKSCDKRRKRRWCPRKRRRRR